MLRGILFPYANKYIRRQLDSAINHRFSIEFTRLILLMAHMIKILAEMEPLESYYTVKDELNNSFIGGAGGNSNRLSSIGSNGEVPTFDSKKATQEINSSMQKISLYYL
jgi:hypothetical protein